MPDIPPSLRAALADRYPLERVLGQGGMATVYLARDLKHDRPVAVKVLRPEIGILLGRDRFEREIRRTAALTHPNIIPIYDSGEAAGYLYYVMPVVEGESLKDRLGRERQLAQAETVRLLEQIAAALAHAHLHGLVHRDIKPANILLSGGQAIVADFGIALATSEIEESRLTETGLSVGTPAYMSPEQAAGHRDLDPRADQYSLACVVFEMLGGDPPFTGSTPQAVIARQITDLPPSLRTVRPDLPAALEPALRRALSKVPGDRFPSVTAFAAALREAGTAAAPAPADVSHPWRRRLTGAALALALLATGVWAWARTRGAEDRVIRSIAVLPPENLSGDTATAFLVSGIQEGLITELGQLREVRVKPRSAVLSYWTEHRSIPEVVTGLAVDGVVELSFLPSRDSLRLTAKLVRGSTLDVVWAQTSVGARAEILQTLAHLARKVAEQAGLPGQATRATRLAATRRVEPEVYELVERARAYNYFTREGQERAVPLLQRALALDPLYPAAYAELSRVIRTQILFANVSPAEYSQQALAAARKAVELDSLDGNNYTALADAEFSINWDWAAAERAFARANELNPSLAGNSQTHAEYLTLTGRFDEALAEVERVVRNDPLNYNARVDRGWINFFAHRYPEVIQLFRGQKTKGELQQLGWAYAMMDSATQAVEVTTRMLADPSEVNDQFFFGLAAAVYGLAGRPAEARRLRDSMLAVARREAVPVNAYGMGIIDAALGEDAEAIRWFERLLKERDPKLMFAATDPFIPDRLRVQPRMQSLFRAAGFPAWAGQPFNPSRGP